MASANLCLLISGPLDSTKAIPRAINAWNYLNVLGARELRDKNESSEQCQFLVKHVESCLTWVNRVLQPLASILSSVARRGGGGYSPPHWHVNQNAE